MCGGGFHLYSRGFEELWLSPLDIEEGPAVRRARGTGSDEDDPVTGKGSSSLRVLVNIPCRDRHDDFFCLLVTGHLLLAGQ